MKNGIKHLGIIIDGNRRFSKRTGLPYNQVYKLGAQKVYEVVRYVFTKTDIPELSIYALSYDNLLRKSKELDAILKSQKEEFDRWIDDSFFEKYDIKIRFIGELNLLPIGVVKSCIALMEKTSNNKGKTLNLLMAYFGSREIVLAVERILKHKNIFANGNGKNIDVQDLIQQNLSIKEPVDLIIRTGGGARLSGFLPWQSEYAELYTIKKLWPEVEAKDIQEAIEYYNTIEAKKGK
jgi:undecaprenyl diphosphate synthase